MQQLAAERVVFSRGRLVGGLIVVFLGCNRGIAKGGKLVSIRGGSTFCSTIRTEDSQLVWQCRYANSIQSTK